MKFSTFIFILFLITGCGPEDSGLASFKNLEGNWEARMDSITTFTETWKFENGKLTGIGTEKRENEIISSEKISINSFEGNIYYTVIAPGNPAPVMFKLIKSENDKYVFANPAHDFPQWIAYEFIGRDSMNVLLGGKEGPEMQTVRFKFARK